MLNDDRQQQTVGQNCLTNPAMSWGKTDQEVKVQELFSSLEGDFKKLDKAKDPNKAQPLLKEVTKKLKDAKA